MRKIFEVLRLSVADGRSHREIARAIIASPTTVGEILRRAKLAGLTYPLPAGTSEAEVEALLARGLDPDLPAMRAIGVPQIAQYLTGAIDRDEALTLTQAATRQYAKRQYTWFRNQPPADWPRHTESLNNDSIGELAIILRQRLLTG